MAITKVFRSGNSMAVRLPREFELPVGEVEILKRGDELIVRPKHRSLADVVEILGSLSPDFMAEGRQQPPMQKRKNLKF